VYWADYWARWGATLKYCIPFRSHVLKHTAKMSTYRVITSQTVILEAVLYFNVFLSSRCKAELDFHPRELLYMDIRAYREAKQLFLTKAEAYLQKRPNELDNGNHRNALDGFDLRHPKVIEDAPKSLPKRNGSLPLDLGDMAKFDWKAFSRFIQQPSTEVTFKEKKWAKGLLQKRSVYKGSGSWMTVFLEDTLPGPRIPKEDVSENPGWKLG